MAFQSACCLLLCLLDGWMDQMDRTGGSSDHQSDHFLALEKSSFPRQLRRPNSPPVTKDIFAHHIGVFFFVGTWHSADQNANKAELARPPEV